MVAVLGKQVYGLEDDKRVGGDQKAKVDSIWTVLELDAREREKGKHVAENAEYENSWIESECCVNDCFSLSIVHFSYFVLLLFLIQIAILLVKETSFCFYFF